VSTDQWPLGDARWACVIASIGRAVRMSEWRVSRSRIVAAQREGEWKYVAQRDEASCS
jgi:hypothetical protein